MIIAGGSSNIDITVTLDGDGIFIAPEFIQTITFKSPGGMQTIRLGFSAGADDIMIDTDIGPLYDESFHKTFLPGTAIYVSGVVSPITLKIRR